jgi:inhibitor of KinA
MTGLGLLFTPKITIWSATVSLPAANPTYGSIPELSTLVKGSVLPVTATPDSALRIPHSAFVQPLGDSALLVVFGEAIDVALNAQVHALAAVVEEVRAAGDSRWGLPVPAYSSLLAPYDPLRWVYEEAAEAMHHLLAALPSDSTQEPAVAEVVEIPVRYGGEGGPDLGQVAELHGMRPEEVVALHSGALYRVFMLGFAPGFAYMGPLPPALVTSRRASPRTRVPAGSVGIAGNQTGIYPLATPGGWRLLGHTDAPLWDPRRDPPALLRPGQFVRFRPV